MWILGEHLVHCMVLVVQGWNEGYWLFYFLNLYSFEHCFLILLLWCMIFWLGKCSISLLSSHHVEMNPPCYSHSFYAGVTRMGEQVPPGPFPRSFVHGFQTRITVRTQIFVYISYFLSQGGNVEITRFRVRISVCSPSLISCMIFGNSINKSRPQVPPLQREYTTV